MFFQENNQCMYSVDTSNMYSVDTSNTTQWGLCCLTVHANQLSSNLHYACIQRLQDYNTM